MYCNNMNDDMLDLTMLMANYHKSRSMTRKGYAPRRPGRSYGGVTGKGTGGAAE